MLLVGVCIYGTSVPKSRRLRPDW